MDALDIRELVRLNQETINPYQLLEVALQYLVQTELQAGCEYVQVDETMDGVMAYAGFIRPYKDTLRCTEEPTIEVIFKVAGWQNRATYKRYLKRERRRYTQCSGPK
jgi:hypothetical protein